MFCITSSNHPSSLRRCLAAILCTAFAACSSRTPPEPISLDAIVSDPYAHVETVSKSPLLYKLSIPHGGESYTVFGTGLKECEVKEFIPSRATTRELFVGFEQIKIGSQGFATLEGENVYRSELTANIDGQPIDVVAYTMRADDCVSDFAFWRAQTAQTQPTLRTLLETSSLKSIVNHD